MRRKSLSWIVAIILGTGFAISPEMISAAENKTETKEKKEEKGKKEKKKGEKKEEKREKKNGGPVFDVPPDPPRRN
jgi:hypothetical protein